MKRFSIASLHAVAKDRKPGYVDAVLAQAQTVTETHVELDDATFAYLRSRYTLGRPRPEPDIGPGPGTELKKLLASIGIHATPTCKCNKMAKQMNEWGPDETLKHIDEVVDVMEETAKARGLPFMRLGGKALVRLACTRARRNDCA